MTRAGDRPPGARSFTAPDQEEWDAALDEFNANVAAQYGTKIETEHPMTRIDPTMTAAEIAAEMSYAGRHLPVDDQYQQRTYQVLLNRGQPPAEAQSGAKFWARLKAADPAHVFGPADDLLDPTGQRSNVATIVTDPETGVRSYQAGYTPSVYAAATSLPAGGPPTIIEYSRSQWIGMRTPINRFSANPGAEYYAAIPGPAPTMFAGDRDLPVITGSGLDPSILRWTAWPLRHEAAFAESRATVAKLIELSLEGDPESWQGQGLLGEESRSALNAYWSRIATWVQTPAAEGQEITEAEVESIFGPEAE